MKRLAQLLFVLCITAACQKEPFLQLTSPSSISFTDQGGSQSISMTTNRSWTVSSSESWCKVSPSSGEAAETGASITVTCDPNSTYDKRECSIIINAEGLTQTISVSQDTNFGLLINQSKYSIDSEAQTINVNVRSNVELDVVSDVDWISYVETRGLTSYNIIFSIKSNESYDQRNGHVIIKQKDGTLLEEIEIIQDTKDIFTPLTIEAIKGVTLTLSNPLGLKIEYRKNGSWKTTEDEKLSVSLLSGETIAFRGDNEAYATSDLNTKIIVSNECYLYGNIMSLIKSHGFDKLNEVKDRAFSKLFFDNPEAINYLTTHPNRRLLLPATIIGRNSYEYLLATTLITDAPELPATTLSESCYEYMFAWCRRLKTASELPATVLADACYDSMFSCCSSLTNAPALPATIMKSSCYAHMFYNCESLTEAPSLPSIDLAPRCYSAMFSGCSGLKEAPELPATVMATSCYSVMFSRCTSLNSCPDLPSIKLADHCYSMMFSECTNIRLAPSLPATNLTISCYNSMFDGCKSLKKAPILPATKLAISCYTRMFACTGLIRAPELPAKELADGCYSSMFYLCDALTESPALKAKVLKKQCYYEMFAWCTELETAPAIEAEITGEFSCQGMFAACKKLISSPDLIALELGDGCYFEMFRFCESLKSAPKLPAKKLTLSCYNRMFYNCKSLEEAPELHATKLENKCYKEMFSRCSSLKSIVMLADDISAPECLTGWVSGVAHNGAFTKSARATWDITGDNGIPSGWDILVR